MYNIQTDNTNPEPGRDYNRGRGAADPAADPQQLSKLYAYNAAKEAAKPNRDAFDTDDEFYRAFATWYEKWKDGPYRGGKRTRNRRMRSRQTRRNRSKKSRRRR